MCNVVSKKHWTLSAVEAPTARDGCATNALCSGEVKSQIIKMCVLLQKLERTNFTIFALMTFPRGIFRANHPRNVCSSEAVFMPDCRCCSKQSLCTTMQTRAIKQLDVVGCLTLQHLLWGGYHPRSFSRCGRAERQGCGENHCGKEH